MIRLDEAAAHAGYLDGYGRYNLLRHEAALSGLLLLLA